MFRPALLLALLGIGSLSAQTLAPRPVDAVRTGVLQDPTLRESSGVARSRSRPGRLYTINDSGNPPDIFLTDSSGRPIGRWRVPLVANRDWEALSVGPCPTGSCLYLGDIGDNAERRPSVVIYRLREPSGLMAEFRGAAEDAPLDLDSVVVAYPDGPHDTEAMWIDPAGSINLVSKGRSGAVRLYRLDARAWNRVGIVTATLIQSLPIVPEQSLGRWVTDAAINPRGDQVAIRTYTEIYFFPILPAGRLGAPLRSCNLAGLEPQGEAVDWLDDERLVLTSESPPGPNGGFIHIIRCHG